MSKKNEEWKKDTMDALESIALSQRNANLTLIENYEMIRGRFFFRHYFAEEGYQSMINELSKEFEMPNYLKHYDIISPVVNTLLGEWQKRPDTFRVKDWSEKGTNAFKRQKTQLLAKYVEETFNIEVNKRMLELGLTDVQPQTEEEAQQIKQQIESIRQQMTPPEIESYMKTDYLSAAEMWGSNRLKADKQKFNLAERERREFEDMLVSDRCFRHFYLTPTGYSQETWNPVNTFFHKSPEVEYVEDGDYVGRIFALTLADIIDRYGYLMTEEQVCSLQDESTKKLHRWNEASGYSYVYDEYMVPFKGFPGYQIAQKMNHQFDVENSQLPYLDSAVLNSISRDGIFTTSNGYYNVIEAYWKSQEKVGLLTILNEETGQIEKKLVDENYIIPDYITISKEAFSEDQDVNTLVWTWVNRVWKGIKINLGNRSDSLYLDVKPLEFQFKGDANIYGAKLPVCGQVFSIRNSRSMSLVDMMKPHQIGYNVAMNQLYQLAEKEVGSFLIMDVNMFPNSKDWGGEDSWNKWMTVARSLGMMPLDTSPQNVNNSTAAAAGTLPRVLSLELGAQMISRMNMAKFFEEQALKQVGFNEYRLGSFSVSSTATGIQDGAMQSQMQTETYFSRFSDYLKRCYRMNLDIAQYVDSKESQVSISFVNNDLSNAFLSIAGTELLLSDLYVFVSNSQEQLRQLEALKQLGLSNNTSGAGIADLATIVTSNSPSEILKVLKDSQDRMEQNQQAQQQQMADIEKQKMELEKAKMDQEQANFDKEIEKDLEVAKINASSKMFFNRNYTPSEEDIQQNQQALQEDKLNLQEQKLTTDTNLKNQQMMDSRDVEIQKIALKNKEIDAKIQKERSDIQYAKIMKGKKK